MKVNSIVDFEVIKETSKKNNEYCAIVLHIGSVKKYIAFLSKSEYDTIVSEVKKGD